MVAMGCQSVSLLLQQLKKFIDVCYLGYRFAITVLLGATFSFPVMLWQTGTLAYECVFITKCQKGESSSAVYFERLRVSEIKCFGCFKSKQLHFHLSKKKRR